jgi:hypothetical protein
MKKNVPTPHFGRRPGVDKIDELIEDTDKALKGLPSRLPPTGPDPKALKDAFLETSPSFQEMLQALEAFDAGAAGGEGQWWRMRWSLFWRVRVRARPRRGGSRRRGREGGKACDKIFCSIVDVEILPITREMPIHLVDITQDG